MAPSNSRKAFSKASKVVKSRWFVGSSNKGGHTLEPQKWPDLNFQRNDGKKPVPVVVVQKQAYFS